MSGKANEILARYEKRQTRMPSAKDNKTRTVSKLKGVSPLAERSSQLGNASAASECLPKDRESNACATRERIEAEALSLPAAERTLLVHRLVDSLTTLARTTLPDSQPEKIPSQAPRRKKSAARKVLAKAH